MFRTVHKRTLTALMLLVLLAALLSIQVFADEGPDSGTCGENLTWEWDGAGTLRIHGTGNMDEFDNWTGSPWNPYRHSILTVEIDEGVTSIGKWAFDNCINMTTITIPDSVTWISDYAFHICESLTSVRIPAGLTHIGTGAFTWCFAVKEVYIEDLNAWFNIEFGDFHANPLGWSNATLYLNGEVLTEVTVPDGVTELSPGILSSEALEKVTIPEGVTVIGDYAFYSCELLKDVTIPATVTKICDNAFSECRALEQITLPEGLEQIRSSAFFACQALKEVKLPTTLTSIGASAFCQCDSLSTIEIPDGITVIEESTFAYCDALNSITLPKSLQTVHKNAFCDCYILKDVYYAGSATEWTALAEHIDASNTYLLDAKLHLAGNPIVVFTDDTDLNVELGDTITIFAGIWVDEGELGDPGNITLQLANNANVKVLESGFEDRCFYVKLQAVLEGVTYVTFTDTATEQTIAIPVTIAQDNYCSYTVTNMPEFYIEEFPTNIYNFNGLYIDSYTCTIDDDGTAHVSFDAYNTNHIYGIVEAYDENCVLKNAALISKATILNTSIKDVLIEGTSCFVYDCFKDTAFTYRQRTNFSKLTHVEIDIPSNGYLKITFDPFESNLITVVNAADLLVNLLALQGDISDFEFADDKFAQDLTAQLINETLEAQWKKDGIQIFDKVLLDVNKELYITPETIGDFADTVSKQLAEANLMGAIGSSLANSGADFAENLFSEMMGCYGDLMDGLFTFGKINNLILQYHDFDLSNGSSWVRIENQGGGFRTAMDIKLESEIDFDPETSLQVYQVELDEELLELVRNADRETYEMLTGAIQKTYSISLLKNGEKVQHTGDVMVYIPIPEELRVLSLEGNVRVYRIEEDGTLTDMDAVVEDGCMVFSADHFSLYTMVGAEPEEELPDDPDRPDSEEEDREDDDNTGDSDGEDGNGLLWILVAIGGVLIVGAVILLMIRKKKQ